MALKYTSILGVAYLIGSMASANASDCFSNLISASPLSFDKSAIEGREISIKLTNLSDSPIGHVLIDFVIQSDLRPMPLYQAGIRSAKTIPGGLLPGETAVFTDYHFMEDREKRLAEEANILSLGLVVSEVLGVDGTALSCE